MRFFALRMTVEPKIPGAVIPPRVFTQPGSFSTKAANSAARPTSASPQKLTSGAVEKLVAMGQNRKSPPHEIGSDGIAASSGRASASPENPTSAKPLSAKFDQPVQQSPVSVPRDIAFDLLDEIDEITGCRGGRDSGSQSRAFESPGLTHRLLQQNRPRGDIAHNTRGIKIRGSRVALDLASKYDCAGIAFGVQLRMRAISTRWFRSNKD